MFVVNVDWFFKSHRLVLAQEAITRGYKVYLITKNTGLFKEFASLGISCMNLPMERGFKNIFKELIGFLKLCYIYYKIKPDLIHHVTIKPSIYGSIAANLFSQKSIVVNAVTGLGYAFISDTRSFSRYFIIALKKISFHHSTKLNFIFQNSDDLDFYKKLGFLKNNNSFIIKGAGVDESYYFRSERSNQRNEVFKIVLVARMLKDKGVLEFIEAAKLIRDKLKHRVEFHLVGGIDLNNPAAITESELVSMMIKDYIIWRGHITDIKSVYNSTDIACLPSYREGLPKSLVEAMAMECPIITTDVPGCRECVVDGLNGFLVPVKDSRILADKILLLVNNPELRDKMGKLSREKMINEMSLNIIINQTFQVYQNNLT